MALKGIPRLLVYPNVSTLAVPIAGAPNVNDKHVSWLGGQAPGLRLKFV
jgi:hypothetical protein